MFEYLKYFSTSYNSSNNIPGTIILIIVKISTGTGVVYVANCVQINEANAYIRNTIITQLYTDYSVLVWTLLLLLSGSV